MPLKKETFVIGGWLKAREAGTNLPFQKCGLVSTIQHTVETNDITLADTTTPQGGEYDSVSRVTSVGLSVNFRELYTWVLGALVWGDTTSVPSTTITDETHLAGVDGTIALAQMPLTIASVAAGTGSTTFKEDDDWVMTGSGIEPVPGGALEAAIKAAGTTPYSVKVSYTSATVDVVQALTNSGKTFEFLFEGENAAGTQKRIEARYFRVRLNPASSFDWINTEDFMGAETTAKVLLDTSKVGSGLSKYCRIRKEV